jgi:hypothetical protein
MLLLLRWLFNIDVLNLAPDLVFATLHKIRYLSDRLSSFEGIFKHHKILLGPWPFLAILFLCHCVNPLLAWASKRRAAPKTCCQRAHVPIYRFFPTTLPLLTPGVGSNGDAADADGLVLMAFGFRFSRLPR